MNELKYKTVFANVRKQFPDLETLVCVIMIKESGSYLAPQTGYSDHGSIFQFEPNRGCFDFGIYNSDRYREVIKCQ